METVVIPQTVATETKTTVVPVQAQEKPNDIITRASAVKPNQETSTSSEAKFDVKDIEKITDPVAKDIAQRAYKSFQADYTRKTQDLAQQKRDLETSQSLRNRGFSTSEIDELLSNPQFVQAAQEKQRTIQPQQTVTNGNGDLTEEEFSYLAPEMQKVYIQQKQTRDMVAQLTGQLQSAQVEKEDLTLKGKYANYNPEIINQTYRDMMSGKLVATREHLFKAIDYEDMAKRAYELGRADEKNGISQARQASTQVAGVNTQTMDSDIPTKLKGESHMDFFRRLAQNAKAKLGQT